MSKQAEKAQATRQKLLNAAVDSLNEVGYFGSSTVKIAERAGVARGTMLHHYPTKDALVLAALEEVLTRRVQDFEREIASVDVQDLGVMMRTLWQALKGPTFNAWLELAVASRTHPPLTHELHALMKRFDTMVMTMVENRIPADLLQPFDLKTAVSIGFSAFNGLAMDRLQMSSEEVDLKVDALIQMIVMVFGQLKSQASDQPVLS